MIKIFELFLFNFIREIKQEGANKYCQITQAMPIKHKIIISKRSYFFQNLELAQKMELRSSPPQKIILATIDQYLLIMDANYLYPFLILGSVRRHLKSNKVNNSLDIK